MFYRVVLLVRTIYLFINLSRSRVYTLVNIWLEPNGELCDFFMLKNLILHGFIEKKICGVRSRNIEQVSI